MITVCIHFQGKEFKCRFSKKEILIGPESAIGMDIPLPITNLEIPHVAILEMAGQCFVINRAHDPSVLLNGLSFGKRILKAGDLLQIQDISIEINKIDTENKIERLKSDRPPVANLAPSIEFKEEPTKLTAKAKKVLIASAVFAACCLLTLTLLFFATREKNFIDELNAARGASDAAMAILHAKIEHIQPPNQNWSDHKFLEKNLQTLLPDQTFSYCDIDEQGKFLNCPYTLKIYSNADFSRFLIVAEPDSNWNLLGAKKKSIVIDTVSLEVRQTNAIDQLDAILAGPLQIDKTNRTKVSQFTYEADLVELSWLDEHDPSAQFLPPESLREIAPGAENKIYNAPRYYKLTEPLLTEAVQLNLKEASLEVKAKFLNELQSFRQYPDWVLYTTGGKQAAIEALDHLSRLLNAQNLLIAYFNPKSHQPPLLIEAPKSPTPNQDQHVPTRAIEGELKQLSQKIFNLLNNHITDSNPRLKEDLLIAYNAFELVDSKRRPQTDLEPPNPGLSGHFHRIPGIGR